MACLFIFLREKLFKLLDSNVNHCIYIVGKLIASTLRVVVVIKRSYVGENILSQGLEEEVYCMIWCKKLHEKCQIVDR